MESAVKRTKHKLVTWTEYFVREKRLNFIQFEVKPREREQFWREKKIKFSFVLIASATQIEWFQNGGSGRDVPHMTHALRTRQRTYTNSPCIWWSAFYFHFLQCLCTEREPLRSESSISRIYARRLLRRQFVHARHARTNLPYNFETRAKIRFRLVYCPTQTQRLPYDRLVVRWDVGSAGKIFYGGSDAEIYNAWRTNTRMNTQARTIAHTITIERIKCVLSCALHALRVNQHIRTPSKIRHSFTTTCASLSQSVKVNFWQSAPRSGAIKKLFRWKRKPFPAPLFPFLFV